MFKKSCENPSTKLVINKKWVFKGYIYIYVDKELSKYFLVRACES